MDKQLRAKRPFIVVVDDEPVIADTVVMVLEKSGYLARAAYSAEDALEISSTHKPDAVISDVVMPGINGIELALQLRSAAPGCKVLLLSGDNTTEELLNTAVRSGFDLTVLAKPLPPSFRIAGEVKGATLVRECLSRTLEVSRGYAAGLVTNEKT